MKVSRGSTRLNTSLDDQVVSEVGPRRTCKVRDLYFICQGVDANGDCCRWESG